MQLNHKLFFLEIAILFHSQYSKSALAHSHFATQNVKMCTKGMPGWLSQLSNFSSGHNLTVLGFETHIGLCADSSEPGICFRFCVCLSLCPYPACARVGTRSLSKRKKKKKELSRFRREEEMGRKAIIDFHVTHYAATAPRR